MKTMETILTKEMEQLKKIVKEAKKRLETAPKGNLRITKKRGGVEYYYKNADISNCNGKYIKKKERALIFELAQRDYDICVVKKAEERIKCIHVFLKKYKETSLQEIDQKMNPYRRELVREFTVSDEEYIKQW